MINQNRRAFLDTIAYSEGTAKLGDNGYNVLFGSTKDQVLLFTSYARHPGILIDADGRVGGLQSTAAGRYQLLYRYYGPYKKLLNLPDFSPLSQDRIALQQIKERGALDDIDAGMFDQAIKKCSNIWASFPGAGYGQHENNMDDLRRAFMEAGGIVKM